MKIKSYHKKGISLFVAVLVASVATLFSFAISDIALREVILSQTGKDSQISFYAANTGIECALFWDLKKNGFTLNPDPITCNGATLNPNMELLGGPGGENERWELTVPLQFPLYGGDENEACFIIDQVNKDITREDDQIIKIDTEMIVKGYNTCDEDSPRRLERALRVEY